ncbi:hypothetical protein Taro_008354, partial [Colocasia esculenta]|nr:hypothetical protein [Colocasia esculenta]
IPTNMAGLIEYRAHPFWNQKYCPSHELDGTPQCCSCERMETRDTRYISLDDGRKLCLECLDSAIMDASECQPLFLDIQKFYEGLNMKLTQQIPLLLVERQALNEAMEGKKNGHHHLPETRGLCLSEEQTVSTILRRQKIGTGSRVTKMIIEPYRLSQASDVTAILILYGLPRNIYLATIFCLAKGGCYFHSNDRILSLAVSNFMLTFQFNYTVVLTVICIRLLTGSILAHEMMHAWLRLNGESKGHAYVLQSIFCSLCILDPWKHVRLGVDNMLVSLLLR